MNGELPPPIPMSEDDLISGAPSGSNEPIIPPPREFLGGSVSSMDEQHPRGEDNLGPPPKYMYENRPSSVGSSTHNHTSPQHQKQRGRDQIPPEGREVCMFDLFPEDIPDGPGVGLGAGPLATRLAPALPRPLLLSLVQERSQVCIFYFDVIITYWPMVK